ncbi:hypothetical protein JNL27_16010 [bacterium]|nr:hypothetical protein [bacterium]
MKNLGFFFVMILSVSLSAQAQFRTQTVNRVDVKSGITTPMPGTLAEFLSPERFYMNQSYGLTYYTGGSQSGSIGMYTNSLNFRLSNPLFLRVDLGVMHQPFGGPKGVNEQNAQFLHGAELIYKPNKSFQMQVGYSTTPYYNNGYGFYQSPFGNSGMYDASAFSRKP